MCIIVFVPKDVPPPTEDVFKRCWAKNDDYCGFMYVDDNDKLTVRKYKTFNGFMTNFTETHAKFGKTSPFVVHFRLASAGWVDLANTHPFYIDKDMAFCHNGTIVDSAMEEKVPGKDLSDTRKFGEYILKQLPEGWWENECIMDLIRSFVSPSRIVFMRSDRSVRIIGENLVGASWTGGCWYSCAIPPPVVIQPKNKLPVLLPPKCECCGALSLNVFSRFIQGTRVDLCNDCSISWGGRRGSATESYEEWWIGGGH